MSVKYRTIVADPPWDHSDGTGVDIRNGGGITHLPYSSMTLAEIAALPVRGLSDNLDQDAHLYLWTTSRYLPDSFTIAHSWGFHYVASLVWCKPSRGWSTGGRFQNNVEFVLFCIRPKVVRRPTVLRVTAALADAADSLGLTRADIDAHMGTSDMGGWWLSRIEAGCVAHAATFGRASLPALGAYGTKWQGGLLPVRADYAWPTDRPHVVYPGDQVEDWKDWPA